MSDAIRYHDGLAAGWSDRYAAGGFKRRAAFFEAEILPRLAPSGDWLDVGCGSGVFTRMLAGAGARALGLDGSPAMIAAAREASRGASTRYDVARVEDATALAETFDGAICLSVLEYVADPERALAGIVGRVKPGGRVAISAPNRASTLRRAQRWLRPLGGKGAFAYLDSSRHLWSRDEVQALARRAGLEVEATLGFDPVAPRALWPAISPSLWFLVGRREFP